MFDVPFDLSPMPGEVIAGRYRVVRHLASGGFGDLYLAEQVALRRMVALKVLRPEVAIEDETVRRFEREARTACRLAHPNLVVYHDFGADADGRLFLVMEYLAGRSLAEVLDETAQLPLGRVLHVVSQVCDAIQAAHDAGVVHRDIKPGNVMLVPRAGDPDFVKVIDFGILKELCEKDLCEADGRARRGDDADLTRPDEVLGTPEYLAPEIIRGDPFDGRADQYAAGVLLYEMIVGKRPFGGPSALAVLEAQVLHDAIPLGRSAAGRAVPAVLESLVRRAMAKGPDDRFASMADFAAALRAVGRAYRSGPQGERTRRPDDPSARSTAGETSTAIDFLGIEPASETLALPREERSPGQAPAVAAAGPPSRRRAWVLAAVVALMAATGGLLALLTA